MGALAEKNRSARMSKHGKIPGCLGAIVYMAMGFMKDTLLTIFGQNTIQFTNDRVGLTRSAMFLFVFIIIHAVGNLHVFLGPNDFNGYGYFYVRLYPTGFGLPANIVEIYVALCALLHVLVALKRTWDISLNYKVSEGKMNLAISGICLLSFMLIHLFQSLGWSIFYSSAVVMFTTHMCLGWAKCVSAPALEIPKRYHNKAAHIGYIMTAFIALLYISFPVFTHIFQMPVVKEQDGSIVNWSPECTWDKAPASAVGMYDLIGSTPNDVGANSTSEC